MTGMAGELPAEKSADGADERRDWSSRRGDAAAEHVAARERVRSEFTWERCAARCLATYDQLVKERR